MSVLLALGCASQRCRVSQHVGAKSHREDLSAWAKARLRFCPRGSIESAPLPTLRGVSFLGKFQSHSAVAVRVFRPALAHLDEQEQMDRRFDHRGDLSPSVGADRLDGLPVLAEHDFALAFPLDIDRLLDARRTILELFPLIGLNR